MLLNVGSCGLHVHAALCAGCQATHWKIDGLLRALWCLFHDSPVRRDLKFCATKWIKDDRVAERTLEIWPNVEKYIQQMLKEPKSKQPTSASFSTIENATKDVLVLAKLQVFVYITKVLKLFLVKYQTDEPVIMFLAEDLQSMCSKLMHTFVKKSVLASADLDVLDKQNHKVATEIDIGFAAKAILQLLQKAKQ